MILIKDHKARFPEQRAMVYATKMLKISVDEKVNTLLIFSLLLLLLYVVASNIEYRISKLQTTNKYKNGN